MKELIEVIGQLKKDIIGFEYSEDTIYRWVDQKQFDQLINLLQDYKENRKK